MRILVIFTALLAAVPPAVAAPAKAWRQVIPAAASTPGADGSTWRTDVTVTNVSEAQVRLTLELIPSATDGGPGTPAVTLPDSLAPAATITLPDVLGSSFPDHAIGALVVTARDVLGQPAEVVATARTWSEAANGIGSFGQGMAAVPWPDDGDLAGSEQALLQLEASDDFRTNLGLVNLSGTTEQRFAVEITDTDGELVGTLSYTLGPRVHVQRNNVLAELGLTGRGFTAMVRLVSWSDITPGVPGAIVHPDWTSYASRVDRRTNDPTTVEPQLEVTTHGPQRMRLVPVAASVAGNQGSYWRTDLAVHNPADEGRGRVVLWPIPSGGAGFVGELPFAIFAANPHETVVVEDVLGTRFTDLEVAALLVFSYSTSEPILDVRVDSRTWTPAGDGNGSLGQGIPSLPLVARSEPVVLTGLESSAGFRTNLGLVNPSKNIELEVLIEVRAADGMPAGTVEYTMPPLSHRQVNGVLDRLGLSGGSYSALVTITDSANLFLEPSDSWDPMLVVYGSRVDQHTNDPTWISAASLADPPPESGGGWVDLEADAPWYGCPDEDPPAEATVVRAFDQAYHYFGGGDNTRSITVEVDFPTTGEWNQVALRLHLECPASGDCDDWDRTGSLQLVLNPEAPAEEWEYLEIIRHITPYKTEMCQYVDITPLEPLLEGRQTLVSWIDTWVGPGHSSGEGWRITYDFVFYPGEERGADEIHNIWGRRNITIGNLDPEHTVEVQLDPGAVTIPADATRVEARLITTGHAFGNSDNCAEFCPLRQDVWVDDQVVSVLPWRTDCEYNPVSPQPGTWQYDRNGWCPGTVVPGHALDLTGLVTPGAETVLDLDVRTMDGAVFENTQHADLEPYEYISMQLFIWRE